MRRSTSFKFESFAFLLFIRSCWNLLMRNFSVTCRCGCGNTDVTSSFTVYPNVKIRKLRVVLSQPDSGLAFSLITSWLHPKYFYFPGFVNLREASWTPSKDSKDAIALGESWSIRFSGIWDRTFLDERWVIGQRRLPNRELVWSAGPPQGRINFGLCIKNVASSFNSPPRSHLPMLIRRELWDSFSE